MEIMTTKEGKKHPYLHCNLIDRAKYTTITMNLMDPHIHQCETKLHVGSYIHIENLEVSSKSDNTIKKYDMPFVLKVLSTMSTSIVKVVKMSSYLSSITQIILLGFENAHMSNVQ